MRIFKKIFIFSLITTLIIDLASQMLLKNNEIKNKMSFLYEIESQYVYSEKEIESGHITIQVSNPSDNLFLLQNGEKIAVLNNEKLKIDISDNSVIEIDGRNTDSQCSVKIIDISSNIDGFYEKNIDINSNIIILGRFFIN